eukprot:scaffold37760_cov72-Phaeocystis_antarctica.AAC.4
MALSTLAVSAVVAPSPQIQEEFRTPHLTARHRTPSPFSCGEPFLISTLHPPPSIIYVGVHRAGCHVWLGAGRSVIHTPKSPVADPRRTGFVLSYAVPIDRRPASPHCVVREHPIRGRPTPI